MLRLSLIFSVVMWAAPAIARAEGCESGSRPMKPAEKAFFERVQALAAALPPAPKGWTRTLQESRKHSDTMCGDRDPLFASGKAHLRSSVVARYQRVEGMDERQKAIEAALDTQDPAKISEATKQAGYDTEAWVSIHVNSEQESMGTATASSLSAPGAAAAWKETGVFGGPSGGGGRDAHVLAIFGHWDPVGKGPWIKLHAPSDSAAPYTELVNVSLDIVGDGQRAADLLKSADTSLIAKSVKSR